MRTGSLLRIVVAVGLALLLVACSGPGVRHVPPVSRAGGSISLLILQSDSSAAYADVAKAIARRWSGPVASIDLDGRVTAGVLHRAQTSRAPLVAAVGLPAATIARELRGKKVVFCQVFNYDGLVTAWMKGVSALPPAAEQFSVWKQIDPRLRRVGMITGGGLRPLERDAHAAARAYGIDLQHAEVQSDIESLYTYRLMSPKIQALWLIPDNRVLSRRVLKDMLQLARMQGKEVVVFGDALLPYGLMSVDSEPDDVARQVVARLAEAARTDDVPGPAITPLTELRVRLNPVTLERLGLTVPAALTDKLYVP